MLKCPVIFVCVELSPHEKRFLFNLYHQGSNSKAVF
jgi:hypothetical protein